MTDWHPARPWVLPNGRQILRWNAPRGDWLDVRRTLIGSSDVAKILGASKYGDGYTVWADKTARTPADDGGSNEARRGQIFEEPIARLWAERYYDHPIELRRLGLVRSTLYPAAGASVDRLSICELGRCLVEIKSTADGRDYENEDVPLDVQLQTQWQLFVTGRDHVHVVALGSRFVPMHRIMHRDEDVVGWMVQELVGPDGWWERHIVADEPPEPTARALDTIRRLYGNPTVGAKYVIETGELAEAVRRLEAAKADLETLSGEVLDLEAVIRAAVGDATEIYWPDGTQIATYRPTRTVDGANAAWRKQHADLIGPYLVAAEELDVKRLVADHPELLGPGGLRYRRTWNWA